MKHPTIDPLHRIAPRIELLALKSVVFVNKCACAVLFAVGKRSELKECTNQLEDIGKEEPTENITFQLNLVSRARLNLFCLTLYFICTCSHGSCIFIAMKMIGYLYFLYCLVACLLAGSL